ncbi:MAG: hypothetical protein LBC88_01600 [Spirochaetaceae bacterium]|jgi:hypothetical protein|nr:hypothetical protein [Spirochaetaceae bacterium]
MKVWIALFFSMLLVGGCTSVPVPAPERNTLLAGKLLVNWNTDGVMSGGNGKIKYGIRMYLQNNQTGKTTIVYTQQNGWILTNKLSGGSYTIQKLYIEREQARTIYQMTLQGPFNITLEEGVVNNMGAVQIDVGSKGYFYRLVDYDVVQFDFQNEFPGSEWNSHEWKNNPVFNR